MKYIVRCGKKHTVNIEKSGESPNQFKIKVGRTNHSVRIKETYPDGRLKTLVIDNKVLPVRVLRRRDCFPNKILIKGIPYDVEIEKVKSTRYKAPTSQRRISGEIKANLPGQISHVMVKSGDSVKKGQPLFILESMKMENEITAHKNGVVATIHVKKGQMVMMNDLLMTLS